MKTKYRWRTELREQLPQILTPLVPKGGHDCLDHEWYQENKEFERCLHCRIGVRLNFSSSKS